MKKFILSICIGVILALTLTSCDVQVGVKPRNKTADKNSAIDKDETASLEGVEKININIEVADALCKSSNDNNVRLVVKNSTSFDGEVVMKKENENLNIKENKSTKEIGSNRKNRKIEIYIPREYKNDISLSNGVGDIKMEDVNGDNVSIGNGTGDMDITKINVKELVINSGVGDTTLNLDKSPKNMKISGGTGDCDIKIKEVNGDITYSGGVGDLSIIVPENAPIKIKTSSGIGDRHIDAKVSEENKYTFNLDNGLGDIKVTN
ncbi:DUF4097 family beta strand repeat-containing protein [uncultured Clostridium sp.]|uniref:DUF4097 family beta strand repeat-containing protein n=1 Tax=uncultured Clostridium sp. TaxID=59620 RepID=UPI0025D55DDF|nr:DUF4097 family beta strand repeat-containing protein [uncultured Clostridium sp.]